MVSHDKKMYNSLLQVALLAGLLRLQPDVSLLHDQQAVDGDLVLGQSWAHTSARTRHASLETFAARKGVDNVIERYQEELFEELHALGRYSRPSASDLHAYRPYVSDIHAYQLLDGEAEPAPAGEPDNSTAPAGRNDTDTEPDRGLALELDPGLELELDPGLELELELGALDRQLDSELELAAALDGPAQFGVWEMMEADLAEAAGDGWLPGARSPAGDVPPEPDRAWLQDGAADLDWSAGPCRTSFSTDVSEDFIQSDVDMSDEDAEAIEVLLRQDIDLGLREDDSDLDRAGSPHDDEMEALDVSALEWASEEKLPAVEEEAAAPEEEPAAANAIDQLQHSWTDEPEDASDPETGERAQETPDSDTESELSAVSGPSGHSGSGGQKTSGRRRGDDHTDKVASGRHPSGEDSGQGSSAESESGDLELSLLDEMIQTAQRQPASMQGRLPFIRTMSMEQRWQDLASLLSLPAQESHHPQHLLPHHHHHPAAHGYPYPAAYGAAGPPAHHADHLSRSVLLQNASLAPPPPPPLPPPPPPPPAAAAAAAAAELAANSSYSASAAAVSMGSVSHLGSAVVSSMNLTTDGLHPAAPAATSATSGEMMYYQPAAAAAATTGTEPSPAAAAPPDGSFFSQILGVEELMDMPITDGHPDWVSTSSADDQYSAASDYAKASQAHRLYEYGGYRPAAAAASASSPSAAGSPHDSRAAAANLPVAQKKHQMYGKRYFQGPDGPYPGAVGSGSPSPATPLKYAPYGAEGGVPAAAAYPPATPNPAEATAAGLESPELKYSCSMDFMRGHPATDRMGLVSHNHTYHLPPQTEGPSGVQRQMTRDRHGDRPKENLTRDEKRARAMAIPLRTEDIIQLPMDEFNERLSKHDLTEAQLSLIRDIRRRGKNKLAAQNCRKRKLDQILTLAEEVQRARDQKQQTLADHQFLLQERSRIKEKYSQLYRHVFQSLRDADGQPYSPLEYSLQQSADGSILLVPRNATGGATVEPDPSTGARRKQRDPQKPE